MSENSTSVDISSIGKSLWLIKVPKNLESALMQSAMHSSVGTLSVTRFVPRRLATNNNSRSLRKTINCTVVKLILYF